MTGRSRALFLSIVLCLVSLTCAGTDELLVYQQVTGAIRTNCYLLHDTASNQAALIDIGGPIDSLIELIHQHGMKLEYILCTHGHPDHVLGVPAIKESFPGARICLHEGDFNVLAEGQAWLRQSLDQATLEEWRADPGLRALLDFDPAALGTPEIIIEDGQVLELGGREIRCIHSPGHSRGSVCFHVDDILFSGDLLFHRRVGRTDIFNATPEDLPVSVRRLYATLPGETKVYPGHGEATDIGSEMRENQEVTMDHADFN